MNNKGFTYIELAFSMAIIAVLAGIAVGPMQKRLHQSRCTEALIELNKLTTACEQLIRDNGSFTAWPNGASSLQEAVRLLSVPLYRQQAHDMNRLFCYSGQILPNGVSIKAVPVRNGYCGNTTYGLDAIRVYLPFSENGTTTDYYKWTEATEPFTGLIDTYVDTYNGTYYYTGNNF